MEKKSDRKWHDIEPSDERPPLKKAKSKKLPEPDCEPICVPQDNICDYMVLAHAYVQWQNYQKAFCPEEALTKGTLFPELWGVYPIPK
ncbi:MAG: spore coat associated protein CotJA [Sporomusaceae bacterium]|nr:spore coat associated protein CotJA [Sporomusaceae bacterium]